MRQLDPRKALAPVAPLTPVARLAPVARLTPLACLAVGALMVLGCRAPDRDRPAGVDGVDGVDRGAPGSLAELRATDPAEAFSDLERELLEPPAGPAGPERRIGFRITAEGAFTAALDGELQLGRGNEAVLSARGTFGGEPVSLRLASEGDELAGGHGDARFRQPVPEGLRESLVIGLTRMGLLHNLARLVSGSPPDHADGTVRSWVRVQDVAWLDADPSSPGQGLRFDIWVSGQRTAGAVLRLDARGLPVRRDQTVRFPGGEMHVREHYEIP